MTEQVQEGTVEDVTVDGEQRKNENESSEEIESKEPPAGVEPKYFNANTLERYGLVIDKDVDAVNRWKRLEKSAILSDIQEQGVINDFHSLKEQIENLSGDDVLVVYDPNDTFIDPLIETEANFLVCVTEEAREREEEAENENKEPIEEKKEEEPIDDGFQPEDLKKYIDLHEPVPRPWESLGSEAEVKSLTVHNSRALMAVSLSRVRRDFGAPTKLSDRDAHDSLYEYRPFKDPNFETGLLEEDTGVQAVPITKDVESQTNWHRQVHLGVQYAPQTMDGEAQTRRERSPALTGLASKISDDCTRLLEQNMTLDVFLDDYNELAVDEAPIGSSADNAMREEPSFTDLQYSKGKVIAAIDAMPQGNGVVAVSCAGQRSFADRVEGSGHVEPAAILIWNLLDPIHPQHVLTSPTDVAAFKFNPAQPSLLAGGTTSGQALLWDLGGVVDELLSKDVGGGRAKDGAESIVKYSVVSAIASSHQSAVTDVAWLPAHLEVDENGRVRRSSKTENEAPRQFVTVAADGLLLVWDTRFQKSLAEMDLTWSPIHSIKLSSPAAATDATDVLRAQRLALDDAGFLCCTEDGEIARGDFRDKGGIRHIHAGHSGPMPVLERSPFFSDIFLTAGDWSFRVWRNGVDTPLLISPYAPAFITCVAWSPSRPGVFFAGRSDGVVDAWDLSDKSHAPSLSQTVVSGSAITSLAFAKAPGPRARFARTDVYLLMVGDDQGVVHPMTIPRPLARPMPQEKGAMEAFLAREVARVEAVVAKSEQQQAAALSIAAAGPSTAAGPGSGGGSSEAGQGRSRVTLDSEAREAEYRALESTFKRKFGLTNGDNGDE